MLCGFAIKNPTSWATKHRFLIAKPPPKKRTGLFQYHVYLIFTVISIFQNIERFTMFYNKTDNAICLFCEVSHNCWVVLNIFSED